MSVLDGRAVIVTGAGRGLGRAHALELAANGALVVVSDVDDEPARVVAKEITSAGGTAVAIAADVADEESSEALVAGALAEFGELHAVVNNAGILRDRMLVTMSVAEWDAVLNVHLRGTFLVTRTAARHWRERSKTGRPVGGRVVNTTSAAGLFGNIGQANYGAAKAGIAANEGWHDGPAEDLGRRWSVDDVGLRVHALLAGARPATPVLGTEASGIVPVR
jgi:NAD(P)-dependent dehydrogenase (short-subunit alcohol dehydrogenase family)